MPFTPSQEATFYLQRLVSDDPEMPTELGSVTVVSIDMHHTETGIVMELALDDGTTIRMDVTRYARDAKEN